MSHDEKSVLEIIYRALNALNAERSADDQIDIGPDTSLFGKESRLDSLSLVSVIVDLETLVADEFGTNISLTDDKAINRNPVPFTSVRTLKDYILEQLGA